MTAVLIAMGLARGWLVIEDEGWHRFTRARGRIRLRPDLPGLPVK